MGQVIVVVTWFLLTGTLALPASGPQHGTAGQGDVTRRMGHKATLPLLAHGLQQITHVCNSLSPSRHMR